MRTVTDEMRRLTILRRDQLMTAAKDLGAPYELVLYVAEHGKLPVPNLPPVAVPPRPTPR